MIYLINRREGLSWIQEALLVRELVDQDGLRQTEAARLVDHHKSWVNRRLMIIRRLAPEIMEDLCLELLPPGSAVSLAFVKKEQAGLPALQNILQILSIFKNQLPSQDTDSIIHLRNCLSRIQSEIYAIQSTMEKQ